MNHTFYMDLAINEAKKAGQNDEVPIGALSVAKNGEILSASYNQTIGLSDPTAHAEIMALRKASENAGNYRLPGTLLYVTIEPCMMCMGAIIHARVATVIFGARDPKWGSAGSLYNFSTDDRLNHRVNVIEGVLEEPCRDLIQNFFRNKRRK